MLFLIHPLLNKRAPQLHPFIRRGREISLSPHTHTHNMVFCTQTLCHETLISTNFNFSARCNHYQSLNLKCSSIVLNGSKCPNKLLAVGAQEDLGRMSVFSKNCPRQHGVIVRVSDDLNSGSDSESYNFTRKRKVVEHICLLKTKGDISDEEEKDMLDYLYTTQYQMGGIVTISLGRIYGQNPDGYTHAVYMRFQRMEDLTKFYSNSFYSSVLKDHVMPYCHGLISVDYESEVEDDILSIFRKGEEFNYGVELILLISVAETATSGCVEDALAAHAMVTRDFSSLIVQSTQGSTLNLSNTEYTHAAVIRFRSLEAYEMFVGSSEYRDMWMSKFEPITQKTLAVRFTVDPVGTELM